MLLLVPCHAPLQLGINAGNKCSALAEIGDRLARIDISRKVGLCPFFLGGIGEGRKPKQLQGTSRVLFCSLAPLYPRVGHTMDVLSPFISILCHFDWLFYRESCPRLDVVYQGRAWSSSPAYTWHCSLHYFFLQAIPLFPHGVTIVC